MEVDRDRTTGLYTKWDVKRKDDPDGKHDDCVVFVLDITHDVFAAEALLWYADRCAPWYPKLAQDLCSLVMKTTPHALMEHMMVLHQLQNVTP